MELVLRSAAVYAMLLIILRLSGKRSLAQLTAFDFVLLLIIGEATQQAMVGENNSTTGTFIVILTLLGLHRITDVVTYRSERADKLVNGAAVVLVEDGRFNEEFMRVYRVTHDEILEQARTSEAIERLDQIRYAV